MKDKILLLLFSETLWLEFMMVGFYLLPEYISKCDSLIKERLYGAIFSLSVKQMPTPLNSWMSDLFLDFPLLHLMTSIVQYIIY